MALGNQVRRYRQMRGWTLEELERRSGVATGTISALEKRDGERSKYAVNLAKAFGISLEQLLDETTVYEAMPLAAVSAPAATVSEDTISIPVLDVRAACGNGYINGDYAPVLKRIEISKEDAWQIGIPIKDGICLFKATGDSMEPGIYDSDHLLVDTTIIQYEGQGVYVLNHGGELLCKRLSMKGSVLTVSSDNTAYPAWAWQDKPDTTHIIGKVTVRLRLDWKKM